MLTCFQGYLCFYKFFEKLTEITFLFAFLSNKISFLSYSIFNLLFPDHSQGPASAIACILYHKPFCLVKHFFELFQSFFNFFSSSFRLTFPSHFLLALSTTACTLYHKPFTYVKHFFKVFSTFLKIFYFLSFFDLFFPFDHRLSTTACPFYHFFNPMSTVFSCFFKKILKNLKIL